MDLNLQDKNEILKKQCLASPEASGSKYDRNDKRCRKQGLASPEASGSKLAGGQGGGDGRRSSLS